MMITTSFQGRVFRCIPHTSTEPLSAAYSQRQGGRWNPPGSFQVIYTFLNRALARTWVETRLARGGVTLEEARPEALPDLLILDCELEKMADLSSEPGLADAGLPTTYPIGFETDAAYPTTRRIGVEVYNAGVQGIVTRSATATKWEGPVTNWGEIAIFTDYAPAPLLIERLAFDRWR